MTAHHQVQNIVRPKGQAAMRQFRVWLRVLVAVLPIVACGGGSSSGVAGVTLTTTNQNPRVGDVVHVGATPIDAHGVTVPGVTCTFASSAPGIASVDANSGAVTAIAVGVADITATCGGKSASVTITVQPLEVMLTITKLGNGTGSVVALPAGNGTIGTYDEGTSVQLTATPVSPSTFTGWGGACAGTGTASVCVLTMDANKTVTATFPLVENFGGGNFNVSLGDVTLASSGCAYSVSASGVLTFALAEGSGQVSGTASASPTIQITSTNSPSGQSCTSSPFTVAATGTLSGNDASLHATLADASHPYFGMTFAGVRAGSSITGTATVSEILHDNNGTAYPVSGTDSAVTLTKQ